MSRTAATIENEYGRLKVIKELEPLTVFYGKNKLKRRIRIVECECTCPDKNVIEVRLENLNSGHTQSCGCFCKDQTSIAKTTHGLSTSPIYQCYNHMMHRCYNKNDESWEDYGGRGIKVCREWRKSRIRFFRWALANGYDESLEIDRKNNNKHYTPDNCRFVTPTCNAGNKRNNLLFKIDGETMSLPDICRKYELDYSKVYNRLRKGISIKKVISILKKDS